jgi:hypothetical protein
MGRNDINVAFEPTDAASPISQYGQRADVLGTLVDEVIESEYRIGEATSRRAQAIERARKYSEALANDPVSGNPTARSVEMARRAFVCEIAAALHLPDRTAENLIRTSQALVNELPATLLALGEGRLSYRHAQILVDHSYGLEPASVRDLEARMLPVAQKNTPSRFEQSVRRTRERLNPESMVVRQTKAVAERGTELLPEQDGMVFIGAHVAAAVGVAIDNRVTAIARSLQCDDEQRTLGQLKADVFADLLLDVGTQPVGQHDSTNRDAANRDAAKAGRDSDPVARYRSIRPTLLVTVPAMTLLERTDEPGTVEGYGPIDAATARELASFSKTMRRMITDPVTGVVLAFDRRRYRIPKDLRTWLRVRDGTCRFPSCNRRAGACEIDHTEDWALGGPTDHDNLAHLCKKHHTLKGCGGWAVQQLGGGRLKWTSPGKIPYETDPETEMG